MSSHFTDNDSCWAAQEKGRSRKGVRGNRLKNVKSNESQLGGKS